MDFHSFSLVTTLLLVFAAAIAGGLLAQRLKQPTIVGYIASGVLLGNLLSVAIDRRFLGLIAETGVTFLLFTLGVEFSFRTLRVILRTVAWAAILQILVSLLVFLLLFLWIGIPFLAAVFFAIAASLSSTAIAVSVLSRRGGLETLAGEVATGWLIIQDLAVVPLTIFTAMVVSFTTRGDWTVLQSAAAIGKSIATAGFVLSFIVVFGRFVVPKFLAAMAKTGNRELFLLATVGFVFLTTAVAVPLGLPAGIGAFVAGLLVAETSQHHAIFAEIRPLRDLFAVVFFVTLGMGVPMGQLVGRLPVLLFSVSVIIFLRSGVVYVLARYLGYHRSVAFVVAATLTPMSEFGFIIATEGLRLGALSEATYTLVVAVTFGTILVGTPLVASGPSLYRWLTAALGRWWPKLLPDKHAAHLGTHELALHDHVVVCGYGRVGKYIGRALAMAGIPFVVVDYNHTVVSSLRSQGVLVVYGDPAELGVLDVAQVDRARAVVIALPDRHTQEMIIAHSQTLNRRIKIICRTHREEDQRYLKSLGVHSIVQPEFEAAIAIVSRLLGDFGIPAEEISGKVSRLKIEHGLG